MECIDEDWPQPLPVCDDFSVHKDVDGQYRSVLGGILRCTAFFCDLEVDDNERYVGMPTVCIMSYQHQLQCLAMPSAAIPVQYGTRRSHSHVDQQRSLPTLRTHTTHKQPSHKLLFITASASLGFHRIFCCCSAAMALRRARSSRVSGPSLAR